VYAAEVDAAGVVLRVVVADSVAWCETHLGGVWVETADPYAAPGEVVYCGPGMGCDESFPQRFGPPWVQPVTTPGVSPYPLDAVVFHDGRLWRSTTGGNVWEPGVSAWHPAPEGGLPPVWVQPTGAHDAYLAGARVRHGGQVWDNVHGDGNVWPPGVFGWVVVP